MLSTWTRTVMAAVVIIVIFGIVAGLAVTGRLGDLRYANIPVVHPWPPAGYYQNPFNPGDKGDLINSQQAAIVRSDLVGDGKIELRAFQSGDISLLTQSDTGNSLPKVQSLVAQNNVAGISESFANRLTTVRVGRLADPNAPSATWCVEEVGTSTVTYRSKSSGAVVRQSSIRFDDKFWMAMVGGRWLITDVQASSGPA